MALWYWVPDSIPIWFTVQFHIHSNVYSVEMTLEYNINVFFFNFSFILYIYIVIYQIPSGVHIGPYLAGLKHRVHSKCHCYLDAGAAVIFTACALAVKVANELVCLK